MSWSVACEGTRDAVIAEMSKQFDSAAANYAGKPEGDDVKACKERAIALVNALKLEKDQWTDWNAVKVSANGSHSSSGDSLYSGSFSLSVSRTHLAL